MEYWQSTGGALHETAEMFISVTGTGSQVPNLRYCRQPVCATSLLEMLQ
jgi:hypothetical protein